MIITSEYSTGSIRTTLAAVPRRTMLIGAKLVVLICTMIVTAEILAFAMFLIGQAIFKGYITSYTLSSPGALRAVILCGVLLTLLSLLGFALGLIFRRTPAAIVVFVVIVLVIPILVAFLPKSWGNPISRFLPSTLSNGMLSINQFPGTYAPYGCLALMVTYVVILLGVGLYLFNERDA